MEQIELEHERQNAPAPRFKIKYPWIKLVVFPEKGSSFLVRLNSPDLSACPAQADLSAPVCVPGTGRSTAQAGQFLLKRRILATKLRNLARYHAGRTGKEFKVRACPEGVRVYRMK